MGGENADRMNFKYQVSVQINNFPRCGGGVLNKKLVLTAANCFINETTGEIMYLIYTILIADNVLHPEESALRFEVRTLHILITFIEAARRFQPTHTSPGDLALLELKDEFDEQLHPHIKTIGLPVKFSQSRKVLTLAGYGLHAYRSELNLTTNEQRVHKYADGTLHSARVRLVIIKDCERDHQVTLHGSKFCAAVDHRNIEGPRGVCAGDSGSPLTYKDEVLYGISVASTFNCDESRLASIYTRVTYYMDFIQRVMEGHPYGLASAIPLINSENQHQNVNLPLRNK